MLTYDDVKEFTAAGLSALGYDKLPVFDPGPASSVLRQKLTPQRMVFLTIGGGSGFTTEQLYSRPFIQVRAVGRQKLYNDAEQLAHDVDRVLCAVDHPAVVGSTRVLYITRVGGDPQLVAIDPADRCHFTCNYITESET